MIHKILFFLFLPCLAIAQTDKSHIRYAPSCADTIIMEGNLMNGDTFKHAEFYFWGGSQQFKRYWDVNLYPLLQNRKIPDGEIAVKIHIDTTGVPTKFDVVKHFQPSASLDTLIFEKIKKIRKWKPLCYYVIRQNYILCEEGDILVDLFFKDGFIGFEPNKSRGSKY
jgi:hypothetical protein